MGTIIRANKITPEERDELLRKVLGARYNAADKNLVLLNTVIDHIGYADNAFSVFELTTFANTLLTKSRFFAAVSSGAAIASIALIPIGALIAIVRAYRGGHRRYSYRAIAYTTTAWAFNKPAPVASKQILFNIRNGPAPVKPPSVVSEYNKIWRETSQKVLAKLNAEATATGIPKQALQIVLQAMAANNEQQFCEMILQNFEEKIDAGIDRTVWKSQYRIRYPQ